MEGILSLEAVRFEKFVTLIDGIHKSVSKIRLSIAPMLGVKSVHVFWIYELLLHPEGMTATEIAAACFIDRSLVSREITLLKKAGYVTCASEENKRGYNARITLTDEGVALAHRITDEALRIQNAASAGISEDDLRILYSTLGKLYDNFNKICSGEIDTSASV